ncbi:MAG: endonuclease, partial [Subtercola sp.]|nr:endonuclease [Subtercola sp.]
LNNLSPLCSSHHKVKHHTEWTIVQEPAGTGTITWTSPAGFEYIIKPTPITRPMPHFTNSDTDTNTGTDADADAVAEPEPEPDSVADPDPDPDPGARSGVVDRGERRSRQTSNDDPPESLPF